MNKILYYEILRIRKCQPVFLLDDFPALLLVRAQHRGHQNLCVPIVMFNSSIMSIARFQSFAFFPLSLHVFHIFWPLPYHNFQSHCGTVAITVETQASAASALRMPWNNAKAEAGESKKPQWSIVGNAPVFSQ